MNETEKFQEEVKNILAGSIADRDIINYMAIKITRLHEMYSAGNEDKPARYEKVE